MLNVSVSFVSISSKFVRTFVPSVQQASECLMQRTMLAAVRYGMTSTATSPYLMFINDVIVIRLTAVLGIKFPIKCIFRIFYVWKTNRMMLFCNLFIERPSYL